MDALSTPTPKLHHLSKKAACCSPAVRRLLCLAAHAILPKVCSIHTLADQQSLHVPGRGDHTLPQTAASSGGFFHPQLHSELPAIRTASPRSFTSTEARLSHPSSPMPTDRGPGSASHSPMHAAGALAPPESTFAEHAASSPRSPMTASLASMNGLSTTFRDSPMAGSALPRHLSMDASSMRHIGLGQSPVEGSRLGAKHRQSSLGPGAGHEGHLSSLQVRNSELAISGCICARQLMDRCQHANRARFHVKDVCRGVRHMQNIAHRAERLSC